MATIIQYLNNRSPSVTDTIKVAGAAFDLTGSTVKLQMRAEGSSVLKVDTAATVLVAASGTVRYDWAAADVDTVGDYVAWWRVTLASGKLQDTDEFQVTVRDHALPSGNLCSLADVREAQETPAESRTRDELILAYIGDASVAIMREYEREFAPATTAALRTFPVDVSRVINHSITCDLAPYDLRSVSLARLNPETATPVTLVANTDYMLMPFSPATGVYTSIAFRNTLATFSQSLYLFGFLQLEITGNWGFATVPTDVRRACVLTVQSWVRRDTASFNLGADDARVVQPDISTNYSIPFAARRLLKNFQRNGGFA